MSRSITKVRDIGVDHKYQSVEVKSFTNKMMYEGKKPVAEKNMYAAMDKVEKDTGRPALEVFQEALDNLSPEMEVRYKKVGGATCTVPREPSSRRKRFLAMFWLLKAARARSERTMAERLALEIMAASKNEGNAMQDKVQLQKLAESNRAYAVFNW